jgi:hypothetical protein
MRKEDKIKEAYGEHWEKVKNYVDANGWLDAKSFYGDRHKGLAGLTMQISDRYDPKYCYWKRPISLSGIENNNGWLQFRGNQPKESNWYWIKTNSDMLIAFWVNHKNVFIDMDNSIYFNAVTHYQPIEEPKPPIY